MMPRSPSTTMEEEAEPSLLLESRDTGQISPQSSKYATKDEPARQDSEYSGQGFSETAAQKRRRVTRACDECRRKKIKCDGKQPCTHCTVYSYDCTFDQPSNRRRNPPPQYIEALERRLAQTQTLLKTFMPDLNLDEQSLETALEQRRGMAQQNGATSSHPAPKRQSRSKNDLAPFYSNDANLESMVDATGELDIDESGNWDYYGHSSNLFFLRRMRDQLGDLDGPEQVDPDSRPLRRPSKPSQPVSFPLPTSPNELLESHMDSPFDGSHVGTDELPSRDLALALCSAALDDACAILNIVHHPTFYYRFDRIYDLNQDQYEDQDHKFLPQLYVVLSLGCLFAKDQHSELEQKGYKSATGVGYKYFWTARQLMDITDCRDLTSLQAIVFMIMFLQCSAKLATCYAYIGVALRSAMRMGLHRNFRDSFTPIEAECRKRVFWTIRKMDIYVGAILGLPQTLSDDDIDQDYPTEVCDECISTNGISSMQGKDMVPSMVAANANFKLSKIIIKIIKTIYPIKGFQNSEQHPSKSYSVSYTAIKEIEMDLQRWMEDLPSELVPRDVPHDTGSSRLTRMQQLLRIAYAHAQLMLYRPFLHYVSSENQVASVSQRSYACAAACVSVSRNIIHITSEMREEGLLQGSYWFTMYSTFFGILSLVFFALENPQNANQGEVIADALEGKETLARLAKRSMAADRCTTTLSVLFEHLGPTLEKRKQVSGANSGRKRDASRTVTDHNAPRGHATQAEVNSKSRGQKGRKGPTSGRGQTNPRTGGRPERPATQSSQDSYAAGGNMRPLMVPSDPTMPATPTSASGMYDAPQSSHSRQQMYGQQPLHQGRPVSQQQQLPFLPSQVSDPPGSSNLSDMAAVMFPSENPFAYPKQPMNTLDRNWAFTGNTNQGYQQQQAPPPGPGQDMFLPASTSGSETVSADDHIDVQLFGPLPPYMQGQGMYPNLGPSPWGQHVEGNIAETQSMAQNNVDMWNHQARSHGLPSMNLDEIFNGDDGWNNDLLR